MEANAGVPVLPLLLWGTPPGLELILRQDGVPFETVVEPLPIVLQRGKFVLVDARSGVSAHGLPLAPCQEAIDIDRFRREWPFDPFAALVDNRASRFGWRVAGEELTERVSIRDKGAIRRRLLAQLRAELARRGGIWARISAFPYPYRGAFNLRLDLDEPIPGDYFRFAEARRPLDDCTTHFVSTAAYGDLADVLADLRRVDTQSHGHFHFVYRDPEANRRNVQRAHDLLEASGFDPVGFAAPQGRWNPGLDGVLESLGYRYSSDFGLGYDDLPFFPWFGGRFSKVLQVPVHPICEGLFLDAGIGDGREIAAHLVRAVRARIDVGEPAFVYGHPERRLARYPEVVAALASEVERYELLWRTTLTEFADWWLWRGRRRWSVSARGPGVFEVAFEEWSDAYHPTLELVRGRHVASLPVLGPRAVLRLDGLSFEGPSRRVDLPAPIAVRRPFSLKAAVRTALDWETVTPLEELDAGSISAMLKKRLRRWRDRPGRAPAPDHPRGSAGRSG
ncbi:polysaccharide deacetylase family protein [Tautonia sociabilis]|uniref:Uncharacterized protein n=1 Tax=Tautonia sociabilis TaxID=2080755 RepID=A0A432MGX2_9BACT|nr:hypothetical protein [Tautonia sociabilis]RUL86177.1 hypothetical protein TsocGM_16565 [Tautonia sociabilis]